MGLDEEVSPKTAGLKARAKKSKQKPDLANEPLQVRCDVKTPVFVQAGRRSKNALRRLERGTGPLMLEVGQIVRAVRSVVPGQDSMVIVYRERCSKGSNSLLAGAGLF